MMMSLYAYVITSSLSTLDPYLFVLCLKRSPFRLVCLPLVCVLTLLFVLISRPLTMCIVCSMLLFSPSSPASSSERLLPKLFSLLRSEQASMREEAIPLVHTWLSSSNQVDDVIADEICSELVSVHDSELNPAKLAVSDMSLSRYSWCQGFALLVLWLVYWWTLICFCVPVLVWLPQLLLRSSSLLFRDRPLPLSVWQIAYNSFDEHAPPDVTLAALDCMRLACKHIEHLRTCEQCVELGCRLLCRLETSDTETVCSILRVLCNILAFPSEAKRNLMADGVAQSVASILVQAQDEGNTELQAECFFVLAVKHGACRSPLRFVSTWPTCFRFPFFLCGFDDL